MRQRNRLLIMGFCLAAVMLLALSGFAVVGMRAERHMPGYFGAMFQVSELSAAGLRFSWMGKHYRIDPEALKAMQQMMQENAALLPLPPRAAAAASSAAWRRWQELREQQLLALE